MASSLPVQVYYVKKNASVLAPAPFLLLFMLLLLLLLLSLFLALNDLFSHSLSSPPLSLFHFLLFDKQGFLSHLLHIQQHYLGFLLSPCPIFILANLIVFTLFLSVYFPSSGSSSDNFSDTVPEKFAYGDASLPEHSLRPSHDDFFLASPPHQHFVLSHDPPPEEYHVLSFNTNYDDEYTYYRNVQSYNKLSNNWEKVKGVSINPYISSNGVIAQKELKKPADKATMAEKVQSTITVAVTPTYKMNVDQGKVVEKGLQENRLEEKASRSTKAAVFSSPAGSQAVVINVELAPVSRRTRILTNTSMQASHPPHAPLAPEKAAPHPTNMTSNMSAVQRPPSSPRVKKSTGSSANDGRYEASKPILDGEKQASKLSKSTQRKQNSMVRSHSDQRLSQRGPSTEVTTVLTSPSSFTDRPHMQRAQSLRSSSTLNTNVLTNQPHIMQRAQSLISGNGTPYAPNSPSHGQVTRSPSFSASLDGLSDSEANKCFSDFIAHRFALMKKELD